MTAKRPDDSGQFDDDELAEMCFANLTHSPDERASTKAAWLWERYHALKQRVEELEQTSGELCEKCGWRGKRPTECEFCQNRALQQHVAELEGLCMTDKQLRRLSDLLSEHRCECAPDEEHSIRGTDWQWLWRLLKVLTRKSAALQRAPEGK